MPTLNWFNVWAFVCNGIVTLVTLLLILEPLYKKFKFKIEKNLIKDLASRGIINKIKLRRKGNGNLGKVCDKDEDNSGK